MMCLLFTLIIKKCLVGKVFGMHLNFFPPTLLCDSFSEKL